MRKRLVRKTFDMIQEIAEKDDQEVRIKSYSHSQRLLRRMCLKFVLWCLFCCRTTKNSGRALASS
jgi:hypothetical protein